MKIDLIDLISVKEHGSTPFQLDYAMGLVRQGDVLLNDYFSRHPKSDVIFILTGAMKFDYMIHNYSNRNIMFFTPPSSYQLIDRKMAFRGDPTPENPILLFDSDMLSGDTIRQTKAFFEKLKYQTANMHVYLHLGITFQENMPRLMQVDDLLEFHRISWPKEFPMPKKPMADSL